MTEREKLLLLLQPIPQARTAWEVPDLLRREIWRERLEAVLEEDEGFLEGAGMAEMAAVFCTASLEAPLSGQGTRFYLFSATKVMERLGIEVPKEIRIASLREGDEAEFKSLCRSVRRKLMRAAEGRLRFLLKGVPKKERDDAIQGLLRQVLAEVEEFLGEERKEEVRYETCRV